MSLGKVSTLRQACAYYAGIILRIIERFYRINFRIMGRPWE